MSFRNFMTDDDFDALVDRLHTLTDMSRSGTVDRWEIRAALAEYGVLPARVVSVPSIDDGLIASLKSICRQADRPAMRREAV